MILPAPIARHARGHESSDGETSPPHAIDRRRLLLGLVALPLAAAAPPPSDGDPQFLELPVPGMRRVSPTLWVARLAEDIWITCFTGRLAEGWYPANGLIVADAAGTTIIDTGWDRGQGAALLKLATELSAKPVMRGIATHFHSDRSGGIEAFRRAHIPVVAHPLTTGLARAYGVSEPDPVADLEHGPVTLGGVELFLPGPGHTADNITAWHAPSRTLFGGCLIKSTTSASLGNLEDADLAGWDGTLARLAARYPGRSRTVPGHGTIAGDAIGHSRALLAKAARTGIATQARTG